jgi:hypothetical protein
MQGMSAAPPQRRYRPFDPAKPDQVAEVGIIRVEEGQIAPAAKIAQIARRLVVKIGKPALVQPPRQIGQLFVGRKILDAQHKRQQRDQVAGGGVVGQDIAEILIGKSANRQRRRMGVS